MLKQTLGWGCALVTIAALWTAAHLTAQEKTLADQGARYSSELAEVHINAVLNERLNTPLEYDGEQLNLILEALADEYGIPIVFDKAALDELAISPETEVSVSLRNISLRSALNIMLKQPGLEELCYMIDDEVLLITTEETATEATVTKIYRVDDFELFNEMPKGGASAWACYSPIITVITECVERDTWRTHGNGSGEICLVKPAMLVITQCPRVHHEVQRLLAELRRVRKEIDAISSTAPKTDLAE